MRAALLALMLATPAAGETLSAEIGRAGIAATEARLAALPAPADDERFALGGLRFLSALEQSFQIRWQNGMTDRTGLLPLLRLTVPDNPAPQPVDPGAVAAIFTAADARLEAARAALDPIAATSEFGLEVNLGDLWFDINSNTTRDPGEDLLEIADPALLGWRWAERPADTPAPVIRFDAADAAWLTAYAHALQAVSQMVLAYDPTEPLTRILTTRAALEQYGPLPLDAYLGMESDGLGTIDLIALILATLEQQPDAARMVAARDHLLAAIAANRDFWTRVATETDNAAEWLPNARQTSALGLALPEGTAESWQAVLADGEALLKGEKLAPYWRAGAGGGISIAKVFSEPRPVDLAGWVQGWAALPYLEAGPLVSAENWSRFESLAGGEPMLLALWFN
jgi:hypothetical protein